MSLPPTKQPSVQRSLVRLCQLSALRASAGPDCWEALALADAFPSGRSQDLGSAEKALTRKLVQQAVSKAAKCDGKSLEEVSGCSFLAAHLSRHAVGCEQSALFPASLLFLVALSSTAECKSASNGPADAGEAQEQAGKREGGCGSKTSGEGCKV